MPEQLLNLKTEGALEADWEEALSWIYTEYDWKKVTELFNNEFILTKLK